MKSIGGFRRKVVSAMAMVTVAGFAAGIDGCSSPTDLDTPRTKRYLDSITTTSRIRTSNVAVSFGDGFMPTPYTVALVASAVVDTSGPTASVWIHGSMNAPAGTESSLPLRQLELRLDSLSADAARHDIVHGVPGATIARYLVSPLGATPQLRIADGATERVAITLTDMRSARRLDGTITITTSAMGRLMQIEGGIAITY